VVTAAGRRRQVPRETRRRIPWNLARRLHTPTVSDVVKTVNSALTSQNLTAPEPTS
jgi:hypothetical protein